MYGAASKKVAMKGPLPDGVDVGSKVVMFSTFNPEKGTMSVHKLEDDEVRKGYEDWVEEEAKKLEEKRAKDAE